jgi:ribosomal-protein-alanine N-acetyltransferase
MMVKVAEITICPMTESDLDEVLVIESESFPRPWTKTHFLDELRSAHSFPLVALGLNHIILGYICPMLVIDEGHILDVAVHKCFRGQGIGKLLVERVLSDCYSGGAEFVSLEVRLSNLSAIQMYMKLGFKVTGRRKRYYENGEDALMMEYLFTASEG